MTDFETGVAVGMLLTPSGGVGKIGNIRAVVDDGGSNLSIVLMNGEQYAKSQFTYDGKLITDSVTTKTTSGETTITKTKTFSIYLIDKLYDAAGKLIAQAVYSDAEKGTISHYLDSSNNIIYIDNEYINAGITISTDLTLNGADVNAVAIAYAIAKNNELNSELEKLKKAYREGIIVGDNGRGETTEDFDSEGNPPIYFDDGGNEFTDDPAITDMKNGLWYSGTKPNDSAQYVIRIYIEQYYSSGKSSSGYDYIYKNIPKYIVYKNGTIKSQGTMNVWHSRYMYSYSAYNGYYWNQSIKKIWISGSYIMCASHRKTVNGEWEFDNTDSTNLFLSGLTISSVSNTQPF